MAANYLAENDRLIEAGKMLRGETRMLPTIEHLKAVAELVRTAPIDRVDEEDRPAMEDWILEAAKLR